MKRVFLTIVLTVMTMMTVNAQNAQPSLEQRIANIEDHIALKNLVDTFSTLSDTKEAELQSKLFTEDATVTTVMDGKVLADLKGRQQIAETFGHFLNSVDKLFHQNGQQTVTINGDHATGVNYCQVAIITTKDGKQYITQQGVRYNDEYVKINGRWYISSRKSNFMWRDTKPYVHE